MKIVIDTEKCEGHNRCYGIVPELIEVDDLGYASAAGDGTIPPELLDKAHLAVDNCPEYAITVEPGDDGAESSDAATTQA